MESLKTYSVNHNPKTLENIFYRFYSLLLWQIFELFKRKINISNKSINYLLNNQIMLS